VTWNSSISPRSAGPGDDRGPGGRRLPGTVAASGVRGGPARRGRPRGTRAARRRFALAGLPAGGLPGSLLLGVRGNRDRPGRRRLAVAGRVLRRQERGRARRRHRGGRDPGRDPAAPLALSGRQVRGQSGRARLDDRCPGRHRPGHAAVAGRGPARVAGGPARPVRADHAARAGPGRGRRRPLRDRPGPARRHRQHRLVGPLDDRQHRPAVGRRPRRVRDGPRDRLDAGRRRADLRRPPAVRLRCRPGRAGHPAEGLPVVGVVRGRRFPASARGPARPGGRRGRARCPVVPPIRHGPRHSSPERTVRAGHPVGVPGPSPGHGGPVRAGPLPPGPLVAAGAAGRRLESGGGPAS
jgi:hypothetical protein